MFNSQKINNDPEPYIIDFGLALGMVRSSEDAGSHWDSHDTYYVPRPEYDNNPNPILVAFRKGIKNFPEFVPQSARIKDMVLKWAMEEHDEGVMVYTAETVEHINHARKVLTRLVNIFGTEE